MKRIGMVLISSLCALSANAKPLTLGDLRSALSSTKNTWVAGQTKTSILTVEEQKKLLGAPVPAHNDFFFVPMKKNLAPMAATSHDWRNVGGVKFSSPVLDQGRCGSCVAFAAVGQLETQMNIARKTTDSPWEFSPQHLFSCGGGGCDTGWQPWSALDFLETKGTPDEACFPYQSGAMGDDIACSNTCNDSKTRSQKIASYDTVSFFFASNEAVKAALKNGPLMATMVVYEDFMFYKSGVYKHTKGEQLGGHAVVIEGYSDADKAWIVRNSWGEDWGEKGYFRIAWGDSSGVGNSTWSISVPSGSGLVSFGSMRDRTVLSGSAAPITLQSSFADTTNIKYELLQSGKAVATGSIARSGSTTLDTTKVTDGAYQLSPIAERSSGTTKGHVRNVFILNGTLTGTLTLNKVKAGDVFSGKQVLEFGVSSTPIPFTQLVFRAKNVATGEIVDRRTPHVAPKINLSLQTEKLANGDWDLSIEGFAGTQSVSSATTRVSIKN